LKRGCNRRAYAGDLSCRIETGPSFCAKTDGPVDDYFATTNGLPRQGREGLPLSPL
jgi:hypothetical protein